MITIAGKVDNSLVSNAFSFLRLPLNFEPYDSDFDWVITGIPFDLATSGRSGSRYGPRAIRQISTHLAWENCRWPWDFNFRDYLKIVDCGDLVFNFGDIIDFCNKLQLHAERLLINGKHMLSFGGDHYITLPLLRAYFKKYGKLAVIDFDAHTDTYFTDSMYDHGSVFFYASKEGLIDINHSVQIGIRTQFRQKSFFNVFDMEILANISSLDKIIDQIKDLVDSKYVYLTFDIDCLDPSIAPGTGTPVIGGLTSLQALKLIRGLKDLNIVGMDIVELAPSYDTSEITALVAATLGLEMLYIQVAK